MRIPILVFAVVSILAMSCSVGRLPMVKGIEDIKVDRFTKDSLHLNVVLNINNPGTWGFRVKKIDMVLTMNDKPIGRMKGNLPFRLISSGERPYNVNVTAGTNAIIGALPDLLGMFTGKNVNLRMQGDIKTRWFIFGKKIHFDSQKGFKLPALLGGFGKN